MSKQPDNRYEILRAEVSETNKRGEETNLAFLKLAAEYEQLAIRSAIVLNGGAMFAVLALLGSLARMANASPFSAGFLSAWILFGLGVLAGAGSAGAAYRNSRAFAGRETFVRHKDMKMKEMDWFPEKFTSQEAQAQSIKQISEWSDEIEKRERVINTTARIGDRLGLVSYAFFMVGCIVVGGTMATAPALSAPSSASRDAPSVAGLSARRTDSAAYAGTRGCPRPEFLIRAARSVD